ncbi:protein containing Type II and III secretion system domain [methanotrophic bacterial endosymbiont of Bathymodiolus sp.]|nr:protein containing Type II and III secretion system domain [methanotrophic bacterial endosymbiont of Bathymodiolus sp.]
MIVLEIDQKVDNAIKTESSQIDSPTILKRQIATTVTVIDGESVVLGGLISEEHTYENEGVPFFKDIPYVGWLFGTVVKKIVKNELVVVITPHVVANKIDARKVTDEYKRKLTGIYYDEDVWAPGADQSLRDYGGLEIQTEQQREAPLAEEE